MIGGSTSVDYLATMEAYRDSLENPYFERNKVVTVADHLNHTPDSLANKAVRINNVLDQEPNAVGAGITLRVFPGDTLRAQVFAKYEDFDNSTNNVIPTLAGYLGTVFGVPGVGENPISPFDVVDDPSFLSLEAWNQFDDQQPRLYLNYFLYDNDFNLVDFGFDQVSEAARIPADTALLAGHAFEKLMLELVTEQAGFVYIYVSNENDQNVTAYFDDLGVEHTYGNIAVATDFYPFGLAIAGRELERIKWRYGYQGEFAEKDEETGWNSFEARMWDPVISRWMAVDPARQFYSPYMGMGNSPMNGVDPDGRDWFKDPDTGQPVWLSPTETFIDNAGVTWEHLSSSPDFIVATHNRDFNDVLGAEPMNSAIFDVYDATVSFFDPVGTITGNTVPAGQATGEVPPSFGGRQFSTVAEGIYPARDQARASHSGEQALIINEGRAVPTTSYSPRPTASGIFLHWGNPYRQSLVSRNGRLSQFSEGCFTTGCGQNARTVHTQFFNRHLEGFHGEIWLRGR